MKIAILDVTGRIPIYDNYLCDALTEKGDITLISPNCNVFEHSYAAYKLLGGDKSIFRSNIILKFISAVLNYFLFSILLVLKKYDIVHIQWLPLLEKTSIELLFLKLFRLLSPKTVIVYTIHNVFPHNYQEKRKDRYRRKVKALDQFIEAFVVHTFSSQKEVSDEFNIKKEKVSVVHHGIIAPKSIPLRSREDSKLRFLMFGNQSYYKGSDLLVEAFSMLDSKYKSNIEVRILGITSPEMKSYQLKAEKMGIMWHDKFVADDALYREIANSDILIFPYRSISQSGALLLALPFKKLLILSDLPSFKETLYNFPNYAFFNACSAESLKETMEYYITHLTSLESEKVSLEILNGEYSWKKSADKLLNLYSKLIYN